MKRINFLTSSLALGVYTPALIIHNKLKKQGIDTSFFTFEECFYEEKREKIQGNKKLYHENPKAAILGQKLVSNVNNSLDYTIINHVFNSIINSEKDEYLFVFSGLWMPVITEIFPKSFYEKIILIHIDSTISPSWKNCNLSMFKSVYFFDFLNKRINYYLDIGEDKATDFHSKNKKIIVHGGGWGMGNYQDAVLPLIEKGWELDLICYFDSDIVNHPNINNYLFDQNWKAWETDLSGSHSFPPICKIENENRQGQLLQNDDFHESYNLTKTSAGIISKPGGGTLLDSFSSETPIIFMDSVGKHEDYNKEIWKHLNFGMDFSTFTDKPDVYEVLMSMSDNIKESKSNARNIIPFIVDWINSKQEISYAT